MTAEDFTDYTEVDIPADRISRTSTRATVSNADLDETFYLYKDKGANFFSADFTHIIDARCTYIKKAWGDDQFAFWALTNGLGAYRLVGAELYLMIYDAGSTSTFEFGLYEYDGTSYYSDHSTALSIGTTYYLKIKRKESVGTYGTLYCGVYSTSALRDYGDATDGDVDNLVLTLHAKLDLRYIMAVQSHNAGLSGRNISGYCENLDLHPPLKKILSLGAIGKALEDMKLTTGDMVVLI